MEEKTENDVRSKTGGKRWFKLTSGLAADIDKAIHDSRLSNAELSVKIEKSHYFILMLRRGERLPSLNTIFDIAEATGKKVRITFE